MKDNVPYDIEGVCDTEAELFIPIRYLSKEDIGTFKHIPGKNYELTSEYTDSVIYKFSDDFLKRIGLGCVFEDEGEILK